jgi:allantoinase
VTVVVRGGTVVNPGPGTRGPGTRGPETRRPTADGPGPHDVVIGEDGRITAVAPAGATTGASMGATVIDADGLLVLPGMIDAHVHFQEPGREDWEGFDTGSAAAAAGGVTVVVDMPIDSDPPTTTAHQVRRKADAARRHSRVDVAIWGGLIPDSVVHMQSMAAAGVVGFKAFACPSGWEEFPPIDTPSLRAGLENAAGLGLPVAVHCELERLGHTIDSEVSAVRWAAELASAVGARLHVVHVSSPAAVDEARRWERVTVETCPHYLMLDEQTGPLGRCFPPIRDAANRDGLWQCLLDGRIDWVASDHSPCPPSVRDQWAGIDGAGLTLPLLLSSGRLSPDAVARLTTEAARALHLPGKGAVAPGYDADLALVDLDASWEVAPATTWSRHRLSAFNGSVIKGRVVMTLVRGRVVFSTAEGVSDNGGGVVLKPPRS